MGLGNFLCCLGPASMGKASYTCVVLFIMPSTLTLTLFLTSDIFWVY